MNDGWILNNYSHEELFALAGFEVSNRKVHNPLRQDSTAGCYYEYYKGTLYFYDFTYFFGKAGINAVTALRLVTGIQHPGDLKKYIDKNLPKLGEVKKLPEYEDHTVEIVVEHAPWLGMDYFSKYFVPIKALYRENVYKVKSYRGNTRRSSVMIPNIMGDPLTSVTIGYNFENRWKIYRPYDKDRKWYGNVLQTDVYGFDTFDDSATYGVLLGSGKDFLVTRYPLGYNAMAIQNESGNIPEKVLKKFDGKKITVIFDNDEAGVSGMKKLKNKYGWDYFILPEGNGKDVSDIINKIGKKDLLNIFHNAKIK